MWLSPFTRFPSIELFPSLADPGRIHLGGRRSHCHLKRRIIILIFNFFAQEEHILYNFPIFRLAHQEEPRQFQPTFSTWRQSSADSLLLSTLSGRRVMLIMFPFMLHNYDFCRLSLGFNKVADGLVYDDYFSSGDNQRIRRIWRKFHFRRWTSLFFFVQPSRNTFLSKEMLAGNNCIENTDFHLM